MTDDKKIKRGLGPRRDSVCYQTTRDIVVPAGTILRDQEDGKYRAQVGLYSEFSLSVQPGHTPEGFRKVQA